MNRKDIALATFALGRFVQYRLDEGMDAQLLEPYQQAYLNITADLDGRERLDLRELPARIKAAGLEIAPEDRQAWPSWLQGHEKWRAHLRAQRKLRSSS
ncbi:MAG TPA: hypothetical protein VFL78_10660, partial [Rhodanobacteraceae bacterium]|nr:hypothetical protein [Rhodanobacteraceae bacterium]